MADESDYTDVTEEEAPARPATKSPFEAAPEVKPEKKKSKSRSRHRRRRHKHRSHRSKSRGEDRRGRAVRRTRDRSSHGDRRGDSKVPEPLMPPKLSRAEQEEKKARKGQKGPNKGGKGGGKAQKSWVCKECGQKTAPHAAAMEQHQYLNERCLSHQFWYKMTKKAQEEAGSWYRAQQMARSTKFQRQSEAQDAGWEVPEEEERSKSPLWTVNRFLLVLQGAGRIAGPRLSQRWSNWFRRRATLRRKRRPPRNRQIQSRSRRMLRRRGRSADQS